MIERRLDPVEHAWRLLSDGRSRESGCPLCPSREGAPETEIPRPDFEIAVLDDEFGPLVASALPGLPKLRHLVQLDDGTGTVTTGLDAVGCGLAGDQRDVLHDRERRQAVGERQAQQP